ncbi:helix-turn-helix domain-containing protein [Salinimicrobium soli]|uniref:helix-turn-helix domain-containing protein n=1 Tax=Salinimicrobium soli TaxID=1254399 RepID=UPI003AAF9A61
MEYCEIGSRIRELVKEFGITNYVLANETGISQSSISRITRGTQKPSSKTVKLISNYFEINERWLLTGNGEKTREIDTSSSGGVDDLIAEKVFKRLIPFIKRYHKEQQEKMEEIKEQIQNLQKEIEALEKV